MFRKYKVTLQPCILTHTNNMSNTFSYRKLVMPGDLNASNSLFGGKLMMWSDEACAIYSMCQLGTKKVVTFKVSEILFKEPVREGDVLEFMVSTLKVGNTSFTVKLEVLRKSIEDTNLVAPVVLSCEFVFVAVDDKGRPTQHKLSKTV